MKAYHILSLMVLQGVAGDLLRKGGEHHRQLTWQCRADCKAEGRQQRHDCFDYCVTKHRRSTDGASWRENRMGCKDICREIYRRKHDVCKAHCKGGFFTAEEEAWCSECPCCAEDSPFRNALLDPDSCDRYVDGGHFFFEEDRHIYRCEPPATDHDTAAAFSVATLSQGSGPHSTYKGCEDNDNKIALQSFCTHPACNETATETPPEWFACNSLFVSVQSRKFPAGCPPSYKHDIDEYCKHVVLA